MSLADNAGDKPSDVSFLNSTEPQNIEKWNPESERMLRELLGKGWTTSKVAQEMTRATGDHFSRNAIIGKARRLDVPLGGRHPHAGTAKAKRPRTRMVRIKPMQVTAAPHLPQLTLEEVVANPKRLSILEIARGQCYWPSGTGDRGSILFCGHDTHGPEKSWCPAHCKVGYALPYVRRENRPMFR